MSYAVSIARDAAEGTYLVGIAIAAALAAVGLWAFSRRRVRR